MAKKNLLNYEDGQPADFSDDIDPLSNMDDFDKFMSPGSEATEEDKALEAKLESDNTPEQDVENDFNASEKMIAPIPEAPVEPQAPVDIQSIIDSQRPVINESQPDNRRQQLLDEYKKLRPSISDEQLAQAQSDRSNDLKYINLLQSANLINQGFTGRHGGKVNDISNIISSLKEEANLPVSELGEQQKHAAGKRDALKEELGLQQSISMQDPASRVSDLYRKAARAKKLDVTDDMSASDIEKLLGLNKAGAQARYYPMTVMGEDGKPKQVMVNTSNPSDVVDLGMQRAYSPKQIKDPRTGEYIEINPGSNFRKSITGPETASKKEAGKETVEVTRANLDNKQNERLDDMRKQFMDDSKDDRTALGAAQGTKTMLAAGKEMRGDILRAIQNQLARASGEKGAMTENDVQPFGGRAALTDKLNRMMSMSTVGQLPESDRKFLTQVADVMEERARNYINTRSKYFVDNLHNDLQSSPSLSKTKFDKSQTRKLLGVDSIVNPPNKVKVQKPDGTTGFIPLENLEKAKKAGYKEIQ